MSINMVETGWQRFLDRLKQLWGKSLGNIAPTTANTAAAQNASGTSAPVQTPAERPGDSQR